MRISFWKSNAALTHYQRPLVGASSSDITQTHRSFASPSGEITTTCTKISFDFFEPHNDSQYQPLPGMPLDEATRALLTGKLPYGRFHPSAPPNSMRAHSPITIYTEPTTRSASPAAGSQNLCDTCPCHADDLIDVDEKTPEARRLRRAIRRRIPPGNRWYAITRGLQVGVIQGSLVLFITIILTYTNHFYPYFKENCNRAHSQGFEGKCGALHHSGDCRGCVW